MEPFQFQDLTQYTYNRELDFAAAKISEVLNTLGKKHVFCGGYAVTLLDGSRMTDDVDIITGDAALSIREVLLSSDDRFFISADSKLKFKTTRPSGAPGETTVTIELLQGGINQPLKLPDANTAPFLLLSPKNTAEDRPDFEVRILHPILMFLTKLKRWMFIAESTRPKSMTKARNDREDLQAILQWLGTRNMVIDFSMYQEKSKDDLLPGVALLLALNPEFHSLLERVLSPEDFKAIL